MRCLFIGREYRTLEDGGMVVTKRNVDFLKRICDKVDEILRPRASLITLLKNYCLREGYGMTMQMKSIFLSLMEKNRYDFVWFDGSCDKSFIEFCYKHDVPTIVFYHNVEASFYSAKATSTAAMKDKIFLHYIEYLERTVTEKADFCVALNERDGAEIKVRYGKKCDFIFPTSFDSISAGYLKDLIDDKEGYLLFVGSNFWANEEGLRFFFSEVAPNITLRTKIVGSICDAFNQSSLPENIDLIGRVENLDEYYANAVAVVSPILSGSGTKTKTIEALRYGKTIIGSPEAMMGVPPEYYSQVSVICDNASDYIQAIQSLDGAKLNKQSLDVFSAIFSTDAVLQDMQKFINKSIREKLHN